MIEGIVQKVFKKNAFIVNGIVVYYSKPTLEELIAEIHDLLAQDAKRHLHTSASYILKQLTGLTQ